MGALTSVLLLTSPTKMAAVVLNQRGAELVRSILALGPDVGVEVMAVFSPRSMPTADVPGDFTHATSTAPREVPAPSSIFAKAARAQLVPAQAEAVPQAGADASELGSVLPCTWRARPWNPAQRGPGRLAVPDAPVRAFSNCLRRHRVRGADPLCTVALPRCTPIALAQDPPCACAGRIQSAMDGARAEPSCAFRCRKFHVMVTSRAIWRSTRACLVLDADLQGLEGFHSL